MPCGSPCRCIRTARGLFTISIMHSIKQWLRQPVRMAKSGRQSGMYWTTQGGFPVQKLPVLTAAFGSRVGTSTTTLATYSKRLKVHRTALFCTRSFTATTHPGSRLVIPYLMRRENWLAVSARLGAVRRPLQNRTRELADNFYLQITDAKASSLALTGLQSRIRWLACHSYERALERPT